MEPSRAPRLFYLHGFASGPSSKKGRLVAEHFDRRGHYVERLDLRVPSFQHMRVSVMMETVRDALGGPDDRGILIGSSLGGLVAGRLAERDPRVLALVLLAPAFGFASIFQRNLGEPGFRRYQESGWYATYDAELERDDRVDFGFYQDAARVDEAGPFPDIRVPTVVVHGSKDTVIPLAGSRRFAEARPHVRLVEVADVHDLRDSLPTILAETEALVAPFLRASAPAGA